MSNEKEMKEEKKDPMFHGFSDDYINPRNIPRARFIVIIKRTKILGKC